MRYPTPRKDSGSIMEWRWGNPPLPVPEQTYACENITLPSIILRMQAGKIIIVVIIISEVYCLTVLSDGTIVVCEEDVRGGETIYKLTKYNTDGFLVDNVILEDHPVGMVEITLDRQYVLALSYK